MKTVELYTDGACSGNPGAGGWGCILRCDGVSKELSGGAPETTNNRMELTALIEGLSALKYRCHVTVYSDSKYILDAIKLGWAKKWQANGWMRNKHEKALNPELWEQLLRLCETHQVEPVWVKGHAGHPENERCDHMAVAESRRFREKTAPRDVDL